MLLYYYHKHRPNSVLFRYGPTLFMSPGVNTAVLGQSYQICTDTNGENSKWITFIHSKSTSKQTNVLPHIYNISKEMNNVLASGGEVQYFADTCCIELLTAWCNRPLIFVASLLRLGSQSTNKLTPAVMSAISHTTLLHSVSWMSTDVFRFKFHYIYSQRPSLDKSSIDIIMVPYRWYAII